MTGIYIHFPFCLRKCPYCDFFSRNYQSELAEQYVEAVCRNISALGGVEVDSIYFGGGTPSLLTAPQVEKILSTAHKTLHLHQPEITLEANPSGVERQKLAGYRQSGVNRLSFGVQSADDGELRSLGRLHDFETAVGAVESAAEVGFENISCDLMLGVEGQEERSLRRSVERLLRLPISHLSAYMLKIESGTPYDRSGMAARIADEDKMCDLYLLLCELMADCGWEHYEISNFAKAGFRSRHNMKYWTLEPYIGIGCGAHSYYGGRRYYCEKDIADFIARDVQKTVQDAPPNPLEEYIMLSLRTAEGLERRRLLEYASAAEWERIFAKARELLPTGLVKIGDESISLTERGFLLSNAIILQLIDC